MLRLLIEEILYNHIDTELTVTLNVNEQLK